MKPRGILIAVEGIDGSGKRTQAELLEKALTTRGYAIYSTGFPQYDSWFGKMVGQFLDGQLGSLQNVDPHFTALLYAGDRFEAKPRIEAELKKGSLVLADRYIGSNLAHQTARSPAKKRAGFMSWIEHLEYTIYGLPRENLVLYLRVPPVEAQAFVVRKSARSYTSAKKDILESSLRHLEDAAQMYDLLARRPNWATIQCFDTARRIMRSQGEIAADVLGAVELVLRKRAARSPQRKRR